MPATATCIPIILFNARKPGDLEKAQKAGEDILAYCISVGGSITGEHGVGHGEEGTDGCAVLVRTRSI